MISNVLKNIIITDIDIKDIRFRFFEGGPGSDANNPHTDYSNPLVTLYAGDHKGIGISFSLGLGNSQICSAAKELFPIIKNKCLLEIVLNFKFYWRKLANPVQARWLGPNCGTYYMAAGMIINAIFDLWAKVENKPLWKLLVDLTPEETINLLDFRYVEHQLTEDEALNILNYNLKNKNDNEIFLRENGLPCYFTTWLGTNIDELVEQIRDVREKKDINDFKCKVGVSLETDRARLGRLRKEFGDSINLYVDSNQVWSVKESINWMINLLEFNIGWIEEPVAPDLIDGHKIIKEALNKFGIDVVTGENCPNSHVAGQLIAGKAVDRFQIDACRVLGPLENILIMLIAKKNSVPICPHAGGSGLDELVPHLSAWNYICCNNSFEKVIIEQVGFCSEYFISPSKIKDGRIILPSHPGYIVGMKDSAIKKYQFPDGEIWR